MCLAIFVSIHFSFTFCPTPLQEQAQAQVQAQSQRPAQTEKLAELLSQLDDIKIKNRQKLSLAEARVRRLLNPSLPKDPRTASSGSESVGQNLAPIQPIYPRLNLKDYEQELLRAISIQKESLLRMDFYDRLTFQLVSRFKGKNLRAFLEQALIDMSSIEASSSSLNKSMLKFLIYLRLAVATIPEPNENLISFVENYTEISSISHPIGPDQFISLRHYFNGDKIIQGSPTDASDVGSTLEERLKELDISQQNYF